MITKYVELEINIFRHELMHVPPYGIIKQAHVKYNEAKMCPAPTLRIFSTMWFKNAWWRVPILKDHHLNHILLGLGCSRLQLPASKPTASKPTTSKPTGKS